MPGQCEPGSVLMSGHTTCKPSARGLVPFPGHPAIPGLLPPCPLPPTPTVLRESPTTSPSSFSGKPVSDTVLITVLGVLSVILCSLLGELLSECSQLVHFGVLIKRCKRQQEKGSTSNVASASVDRRNQMTPFRTLQ